MKKGCDVTGDQTRDLTHNRSKDSWTRYEVYTTWYPLLPPNYTVNEIFMSKISAISAQQIFDEKKNSRRAW